jgi:hypothetical protein
MSSVNKYRLWCLTEMMLVEGWSEEPPTQCYHNVAHEIDPSSVTQIDTATSEIIDARVIEENTPTQERFQSKQFLVEAVVSAEWQNFDFTNPFDTTVKCGQIFLPSSCVGDQFHACMAPDTIIGVTRIPLEQGATLIPVSQTALENSFIGAYVKLYDGVNPDTYTQVIAIDAVNGNLTLEEGIDSNFAAGAYVMLTVCFVHEFTVIKSHDFIIGGTCIKGFHWPANTVLRLGYKNNGAETKKMAALLDYYY